MPRALIFAPPYQILACEAAIANIRFTGVAGWHRDSQEACGSFGEEVSKADSDEGITQKTRRTGLGLA